MPYRILALSCLLLLGCSDFLDLSSSGPKTGPATTHGDGLNLYLAIHCQDDTTCRSSLSIRGTPRTSSASTQKVGFRYTFISAGDTLVASSGKFIDGDTTEIWNLPVIDKHVRFSLLDKKKKHKDYDIDLSPWMGEAIQARDSVTFANFEAGSKVCFCKKQESYICRTIQDESEKISIPDDSSYYSFFKVQQKELPIEVGEYTDCLDIMTTVYWK